MLSHGWRLALRKRSANIRDLSPAAIILGSVLNMLEAVSFGLLIFPPSKQHDAFTGLETQAISLYIMSTTISQVVLSLGGTSLPTVLTSMLAELLPFLRTIASGIQKDLGSKHPGVLPTTMVAFAMASIIMGIIFVLLAVLRGGNLVGYFPHTIMKGVIGAVGISLILFALEVTFPLSSRHVTITTLFSVEHLPLLAASVLPALLICTVGEVESLNRRLNGFPSHPLYVPICCFAIMVTFWAVVAAGGSIDLQALASSGWLFMTKSANVSTPSSAKWNYWALFNFSKVEWGTLPAIAGDMSLLVFIGVLTLPIFGSATAIHLEAFDHSMHREFVWHGIINIFIGLMGSLPATLIYSNTVLFKKAKGEHQDAIIVTFVGCAFFFASSHVLPYIPTILASTLVLYIGLLLMIDGLWKTSGCMVWSEWFVVLGTTLGCTFLGFAQGIAMGLGISVVLHYLLDTYGSRPRIIQPCTTDNDEKTRCGPLSSISTPTDVESQRPFDKDIELQARERGGRVSDARPRHELFPPIVCLTNRVESADSPLIASFIDSVLRMEKPAFTYMVLDFRHVVALNTCVAEFLAKQARRLAQASPRVYTIVVGIHAGSEVHARLEKGGLDCDCESRNSLQGLSEEGSMTCVFDSVEMFLRISHAARPKEACISHTTSSVTRSLPGIGANSGYFSSVVQQIVSHLPATNLSTEQCMVKYGLTICEIFPGHAVSCSWYAYKPTYLVLQGVVIIRNGHGAPNRIQQPFRAACWNAANEAFQWCSPFCRRSNIRQAPQDAPPKHLTSLDVYDKHSHGNSCAHAVKKSCWVLFVDPESIFAEGGWMLEGESAKYVPSLEIIAAGLRKKEAATVEQDIK